MELVEQLQFLPETGVEDQTGQDQDEEALSQLASGLKSDVLILLAGDNPSVIIAISEPTISVSFAAFDQFTRQDPPPTLPLYQQFSVYRI